MSLPITPRSINITSYAACAAFSEVRPDGTLLTDRMLYTREGWNSVRHIMETSEKGESILTTLGLGIVHEGAKDASKFHWSFLSNVPILVELHPDQEHPGGTHLKLAYAVGVSGALRDFSMVDGDAVLGPVTMVPVDKLIRETEGKTVRFHVLTTRALLNFHATNTKVFDKYSNLIMKWSPPVLTDVEHQAVEDYLRQHGM